jgi:hypothetical protein
MPIPIHDRYQNLLDDLRLTHIRAGELLRVNERTSRRWATGDMPVPAPVIGLLDLMATHPRQHPVHKVEARIAELIGTD